MVPGPEDHSCPWREEAESLRTEVSALRTLVGKLAHEMETTKRRLLGPKSERMPSIEKSLFPDADPDPEAASARRAENAALKAKLETIRTVHTVAPEKRRCPRCGRENLKALGEGRVTTVFEHVPERFLQHQHVQEVLTCPCGEYVVTADAPPKVVEKGRYGAGFVAHLITAKCADSIPLYRLEKEYQRLGIPIRRSTMTDLFHRGAGEARPLAERNLALVAQSDVVHADETSMKVLDKGKCRNGFLWTFRAGKLIAYRFAPSRSGETPKQILGGTRGTLVVDGYSGYNVVEGVSSRERAACHAHVRRYFYDALPTAPAAKQALDFILDLYRVEHEAKERKIVRTPAHLDLRRQKSALIRERFKAWLEAEKPRHLPKGPMGTAIQYTLNNWDELGCFLNNAGVPLDNNAAESALRRVALGRKNFLFVGHDQAGRNIAGLYSLVATCEAHGINPVAYLSDVLLRLQTHPMSRIDELLPQNWKPLARDGPTANAG
jgi:transposase